MNASHSSAIHGSLCQVSRDSKICKNMSEGTGIIELKEASKVVPIDKLSVVITLVFAFVFLHEQFTWKSAVGALLITVGTLFMVL